MTKSSIAFIDLGAQRSRIKGSIDEAIKRVLEHGAFITGPEVGQLESQLAAFCGAKHCIACANGTDALELVMIAENIGPGDAVFVPAFTFVATGEVVPPTGASLFFIDVTEDTYTMDPASLTDAIALAKQKGLRPRMVIPVDLFGQPADYITINKIAQQEGLIVLADGAQAFGASLNGKRVGSLATWTTTSFFPAKPLGCYGDGGAIFTDDGDKAALIRSLHIHGKGADKYDNVRIGMNSRLDTLQAAILLEKLKIFGEEIKARQVVADRYAEKLSKISAVKTPRLSKGATSVWAQYTLVAEDRDALASQCKAAGIPTAIYYPIPLHKQQGYAGHTLSPKGLPVSENLAKHVISIPMHPYLDTETQDKIVAAIKSPIHQSAGQI